MPSLRFTRGKKHRGKTSQYERGEKDPQGPQAGDKPIATRCDGSSLGASSRPTGIEDPSAAFLPTAKRPRDRGPT